MNTIPVQAVIAIATQLLLDHVELKIHIERQAFESKTQYGAVYRHGRSKTNICVETALIDNAIEIKSITEVINNHRFSVNDLSKVEGKSLMSFDQDGCTIDLPFDATNTFEPVVKFKIDGEAHSLALPKLYLCTKLYEALLKNNPQITSNDEWDNILPTLSAGWDLVTIHNPHQIGTLDVWMVLRKEAAEKYMRLDCKNKSRSAA